jgi:xanthine dehydrogenase accessory factor
MRALHRSLSNWSREGRPLALATVLSTDGSSPRVPGACLLIDADGEHFAGAVSSGCLENDVIASAAEVLARGGHRDMRFGPEGAPPWIEGLSCGGGIRVRVEPWWGCRAEPELLDLARFVIQHLDEDRGFVVLSRGDLHAAVDCCGAKSGQFASFSADDWSHAVAALESGEGLSLSGEGPGELILRPCHPRRRLFLVGAVEIAVRLVPLARHAGYRTIVVDPRRAYANPERFEEAPDVLLCERPALLAHRDPPGPRDAVLVLSHDPRIDDEALLAYASGKAGYIGALGSRTSHAKRCSRLREAGLSEEALARIEGPAGLRLGRAEPCVIALGMLAGIVRHFGGD